VVDVLDKVMEFPQMGSGPNRQQIIDALRNTAQSASNNIAETASMPVDALAWALRKVGLPVGDKPVMGSDWMREKGLTAPVQEGASKVVGDTIGMISPMGLSKQGAQAIMEVGGKMKNLPVGMSIKDVSKQYDQRFLDNDMTGLADRVKRVAYADPKNRLSDLANVVPAEMLPSVAGQSTVKVYRGVPSDIENASIRAGDWVGIDPKYAAKHGTGKTGKSKVIEMDVPSSDVTWAGTDMNEFFYTPRNLAQENETALQMLNRLGPQAFGGQ
jgi:hypothetical protein